jgi:hypothetical protein
VLGLGYVGLPLAVEFAKRHQVIGFDIDAGKIEELQRGYDRMREVETEELAAVRIDYTTNPARMRDAKYIVVAVPTPIDEHNNPDLFLVEEASRMVAKKHGPRHDRGLRIDGVPRCHRGHLPADSREGIGDALPRRLHDRLQPRARQSRATKST